MNTASVFPNGRIDHGFFTPIRFDDFEVSCVAASPFGSGFSFGSDDGKVRFTDEAGTTMAELNGIPSGEAVNGIANFGNSFAVSSRQEVVLCTLNPENLQQVAKSCVPFGAHGICASSGGRYLAPLGEVGIMVIKAGAGPGDPVVVMTAPKECMNFFRVVTQPGRDGKDLLICAARRGGIGIAEIRPENNNWNMNAASFSELDAIDVCFVSESLQPPALAAVCRDGSLILMRDMLQDKNPLMLRFDAINGRAYRLLSARGHLFLLTSTGLYGLMNLGTRMMQGLPSGKLTTPVFMMPLEAVDASLVGDRWLPVVLPDEVLRIDLDLIQAKTSGDIPKGELCESTAELVEPRWRFEKIRTDASEVALAAALWRSPQS